MKINEFLSDNYMTLKSLVNAGGDCLTVEVTPSHWSKDADTKYPEAITFFDTNDKMIPDLQELTREEFEEFINELLKIKSVLNTEIIIKR